MTTDGGLRTIEENLSKKRHETKTARSLSVFEPLPEHDRTCFEHGIPRQFCTCLVQLSDSQVPRGVIENVNNVTSVMNLFCAQSNRNLTAKDLSIIETWSMFGQHEYPRHSIRHFDEADLKRLNATKGGVHRMSFHLLTINVGGKLRLRTMLQYYHEKGKRVEMEPTCLTIENLENSNVENIRQLPVCLQISRARLRRCVNY